MKRSDRRSLTFDPPAVPSTGYRVSGQYVGFGTICWPSCCSQRCLQTYNLLPNAALAEEKEEEKKEWSLHCAAHFMSRIQEKIFTSHSVVLAKAETLGEVWDVLLKDWFSLAPSVNAAGLAGARQVVHSAEISVCVSKWKLHRQNFFFALWLCKHLCLQSFSLWMVGVKHESNSCVNQSSSLMVSSSWFLSVRRHNDLEVGSGVRPSCGVTFHLLDSSRWHFLCLEPKLLHDPTHVFTSQLHPYS